MNDFYKLNKNEVLKNFEIDENKGVETKNLNKLIEKYGRNVLEVGKDLSFLELYFKQVKSFLNLLLLFLIFFAFAVWYKTQNVEYLMDSIIIFVIFLINTTIGAYQNYSSRKIAKTLSKMLNSIVNILRDGKEIQINSKDLVCGDIIFLKGGDKIPADCYILNSDNLKVDESILTGESVSVNKKADKIEKNVEIVEQNNMLFMNTFVVSGDVKAIVVNTGLNTQIGKISQNLKVSKKKISFLDEIDDASKVISKFAIFLIVIVSIVLLLKGFDFIGVFLIASALVIGSVPEGLPAIVVFLLSKSVHSLAKRNILVKEMGLLETLGSINILCTDKTGTLTTNMMGVKMLYTNFNVYDKIEDVDNFYLDKLANIICLANEAEFVDNDFKGEAEDIGLIHFIKNKYDYKQIRSKNKIDEFEPFSSETRYVFAKSDGVMYKKGAFEVVLDDCKYILKKGKVERITSKEIDSIKDAAKSFTNQALRLIAFSYKVNNKNIFVGFVGLYDKPKEGIDKTIKTLYSSGIDVKMITGDNLNTALAIAKECGFESPKGIEFKDIKDLPENEFKKKILECNVFGRVMPEFKEKIVEVLQQEGNRVAITGDGVNDTIALRNAEVGIVMASGSDIAKESSDMILLNNNFNEIPNAIKEGRGIFANIRKVINYLLTANLAEVLTIFIASFLGIIPFTAIQILWVNFVTDIFPALSLGVDKFNKNIMEEKPNGKKEIILNLRIKLLTLFISIKKVILIFIVYYLAYYYFSDRSVIFAQTASFTWLVLTHFIRIAAIRFDEKISLFTNKYVVMSVMGVVILQLIILYTPIRTLFKVVTIPAGFWIVLVSAVLIGVFLAKLIACYVDYLVAKNNFKQN